MNNMKKLLAALLVLSMVLALTGTAFAAEPYTAVDSEGTTRRIRTCCRGCGKMECGVWVTVENGKVVKLEGDESAWQSRGNCCTKSQASVQAAYHPDRVLYPLIRSNPKGDTPGWRRASWDDALATAAKGIKQVVEKYIKIHFFLSFF